LNNFLAYGWGAKKLKLTNQDSAGGKNSTVLRQVGIEIRQLFSLEMALNMYGRGLQFQNHTSLQKVKIMSHFVFQSFSFSAKNGSPAFGIASIAKFWEQVSRFLVKLPTKKTLRH